MTDRWVEVGEWWQQADQFAQQTIMWYNSVPDPSASRKEAETVLVVVPNEAILVRRRPPRYYVCGNFRAKGASVCKSNGVNADELSAGNTESVCYDTVRETLARFNEVLGAAPPDQKKTLLQLIIREIHLTPDRKIDRMRSALMRVCRPIL